MEDNPVNVQVPCLTPVESDANFFSVSRAFLSCLKAQAQQTTTIMGKLQDSVEFKTTAYATVIIINPADSQIIAYTRTKDNGNFELKTPAGVKLRLLIVHPSFADYEDFFTAESNTVFNFGNINLLSKINLLKESEKMFDKALMICPSHFVALRAKQS